jgi:hypothetical protein
MTPSYKKAFFIIFYNWELYSCKLRFSAHTINTLRLPGDQTI